MKPTPLFRLAVVSALDIDSAEGKEPEHGLPSSTMADASSPRVLAMLGLRPYPYSLIRYPFHWVPDSTVESSLSPKLRKPQEGVLYKPTSRFRGPVKGPFRDLEPCSRHMQVSLQARASWVVRETSQRVQLLLA